MKEYKNKTEQDLKKLIAEKREALRHFRFGSAGSKTKNVKIGKTTKKEIARIMTEMSLRAKAPKA
ncbi:MAG: 50S ribosomal protein L29 [Patescibacteria group bacterium]